MLNYFLAIIIFTSIYAMIAIGLNLQWGLTGLINLGQVAFMAAGAYTTALLTLAGVPFLLALIFAGIVAAILSLLLAAATPRLRDDYLAILTLGFSDVVRMVLLNEDWIGNGPNGITGIPQPFRATFAENYEMFYAILAVTVVTLIFWFAQRLSHYPFGRVLRAIREDEIVPTVVGKDVLRFKTQAFMLGAAMAGIGGGFFAVYLRFIAPDMFTAMVSVYVLVAVLMGKRGSNAGTLLGTAAVAFLLEGSRILKDYIPFLSGVQLASLRLMIIGIILIALVLFRPTEFDKTG
jgi:branched-chain amino acid transport system permease protein